MHLFIWIIRSVFTDLEGKSKPQNYVHSIIPISFPNIYKGHMPFIHGGSNGTHQAINSDLWVYKEMIFFIHVCAVLLVSSHLFGKFKISNKENEK